MLKPITQKGIQLQLPSAYRSALVVMNSLVYSIYLFDIMDTRLLFAFWIWKTNKLRILIHGCIIRKVEKPNVKLAVLSETMGLSSPYMCLHRQSIVLAQGRVQGQFPLNHFPRVFLQAPATCGVGTSQVRGGIFFFCCCFITFNGIFFHEFIQNGWEPTKTYSIHNNLWNNMREERMSFFHHSQ